MWIIAPSPQKRGKKNPNRQTKPQLVHVAGSHSSIIVLMPLPSTSDHCYFYLCSFVFGSDTRNLHYFINLAEAHDFLPLFSELRTQVLVHSGTEAAAPCCGVWASYCNKRQFILILVFFPVFSAQRIPMCPPSASAEGRLAKAV